MSRRKIDKTGRSSVYHVECRARAKKFGRASNGAQRYQCLGCRRTFVGGNPNGTSIADRLSRSKREELFALFRLGYSIREIQRRTGRHHVTLRKYRDMMTEVKCGCGRGTGHRGWCDFRVDHHPIRQAYYALMRKGGNQVLRGIRPIELAVRSILPATLPEQAREDLAQDLIVLILSGEMTILEARKNIKRFASAAWATSAQSQYGPLSLDAPLYDEGNATLADTLSDGGEQASRIEGAAA